MEIAPHVENLRPANVPVFMATVAWVSPNPGQLTRGTVLSSEDRKGSPGFPAGSQLQRCLVWVDIMNPLRHHHFRALNGTLRAGVLVAACGAKFKSTHLAFFPSYRMGTPR